MVESHNYTLYCDESCHLQFDKSNVLCIGGIIVPDNRISEYKEIIKQIKRKHGILHEIKWNTVSKTHLDMYEELIHFFFQSEMEFRCILLKNKGNVGARNLDRREYNEFYFSIVEQLIRIFIRQNDDHGSRIRIFLDLKDSHGNSKLSAVEQRISGDLKTGSATVHLQNIRSHESVFIQLADIFIGAITYISRGLHQSPAKMRIAQIIEGLSGYCLNEGTEPCERKFSIYDYQPKRRNNG